MVNPDELERIEFSARLNKLLDDNNFPPKGKGRQGLLGKLCGVDQKAARKWLECEGFPARVNLRRITNKFKVRIAWLEYGELPEKITDGSQYEPQFNLDSKAIKYALNHYNSVMEDPDNSEFTDDADFMTRVFVKCYGVYFDDETRNLPTKAILRLVS